MIVIVLVLSPCLVCMRAVLAAYTAADMEPGDLPETLKTDWIYQPCYPTEQDAIDAWFAWRLGGRVCAVEYVGNSGWGEDLAASATVDVPRVCRPDDQYNLPQQNAVPLIRQTSLYYFNVQIVPPGYTCPGGGWNIENWTFLRELFEYCPWGYGLRYIPGTTQFYCKQFLPVLDRCELRTGNPIYVGTGNKRETELDYVDARRGRLKLERHYNSNYSRLHGNAYRPGLDPRPALGMFGANWRSTYERSIELTGLSLSLARAHRGDGAIQYFQRQPDGRWLASGDQKDTLTETAGGWTYATADDVVEDYDAAGVLQTLSHLDGTVLELQYDAAGRLSRVQSSSGESLTFGYDPAAMHGLVESVTDQTGRRWRYGYDALDNLASVVLPDGTPGTDLDNPVRRYHYEHPDYRHALTGITDERGVRYATFGYDADGRANLAYHGEAGDPAGLVNIDYQGDTHYGDGVAVRTVTNGRGEASTYTTVDGNGVALLANITGAGCAGCADGDTAYSYASLSNDLLTVTRGGVVTKYGNYDAGGHYGCKVEGVSAADASPGECDFDPAISPAARRTDYTYDARFPGRIVTQTEPSVYPGASRVTRYSYDDYGNTTSVSVDGFTPAGAPVTRTTTYQYNGPLHQLSRIDGPRTDVSDVTILRYHADDPAEGDDRARLKAVEDAGGRPVRHGITYTPTGKLLSELDANGVMTGYEYYPGSDRLERVGVHGADGPRYTRWTYLPTGEVESVTTAAGSPAAMTLVFGYDAARRLVRVTDALGNSIRYTLDSEGNALKEEIFSANGTPQDELDDVLRRSLNRTFDVYNRLDISWSGSDPANPLERVDFDHGPDGMLERQTDGNGGITDYRYDALRRLVGSTRDPGGLDANTAYGYDAADRLVSVTDPNDGMTTYRYDDLGNLLAVSSPDTGTTTYTHDTAGNVTVRTTAAGSVDAVTLNYSYDALGRLTGVIAPDPVQDVIYTWDSCVNGAGRLCAVSNGHATVSYAYDDYGNVTRHQGIGYGYDPANRLSTMRYLSGAVVGYRYDPAGKVSGVDLTTAGQTQSLAADLTYAPFGGIEALSYGNGRDLNRTWDMAYRVSRQDIPGVLALDYPLYDANGNLLRREDGTVQPAAVSTFGYDALDRLDAASGPFGSAWSYGYDLNGNRDLSDEGGPVLLNYKAGSNRLDAVGADDVVTDVAGNTLARGSWTYRYDSHQRLESASDAGVQVAAFAYNGLGQRVEKRPAGGEDRHFFYGRNGELLFETDASGNPLVEYIYLNGRLLAVHHPDTDGDGLTNQATVESGGPMPMPDTDGDGLMDIDELLIHATSPVAPDTDGDGVGDGDELADGSDPLDMNDRFLAGDINYDGGIDAADYLLLNRFVLGVSQPTPAERLAADMNGDGRIDAGDMVILSRTLLGLAWNSLADNPLARMLVAAWEGAVATAEAAVTNGRLYYVHNDHLGTPQVMTDESGAVVWRAVYDPFGRATIDETSAVDLNVRFPGQYYDEETGLHYNYFRHYDPNTGRYLTSDPIGLASDLNTYAYVANNPVLWIDPLGLKTFMCKKPLDAIGGSGTKSGPDILGNPLFHEFLCVKNGDVEPCGGQDRTGGPFSAGKPSDDAYVPQQCDEAAPDNDCLEQCLVDAFSGPRPFYGLAGPGTNCQEWAGDVLSRCNRQCGLTKKCGARGCNR